MVEPASLASFGLALAMAFPALAAEHYEHAEGGIEFVVPDGWLAETDDEVIVVSSADDTLAIVLWVPEGDSWEAAIDGLFEELSAFIQDPSLENEGEESKLNGMPFYEISGKGKIDGDPVELSVSLFLAKKPVIALAFADPDAWATNHSELVSFVSSMRKN